MLHTGYDRCFLKACSTGFQKATLEFEILDDLCSRENHCKYCTALNEGKDVTKKELKSFLINHMGLIIAGERVVNPNAKHLPLFKSQKFKKLFPEDGLLCSCDKFELLGTISRFISHVSYCGFGISDQISGMTSMEIRTINDINILYIRFDAENG